MLVGFRYLRLGLGREVLLEFLAFGRAPAAAMGRGRREEREKAANAIDRFIIATREEGRVDFILYFYFYFLIKIHLISKNYLLY